MCQISGCVTQNLLGLRILIGRRGGLMVSASTLDRVVRVRGLAGNIVLCSWARHLTLTVPLSTQVYKWVPVNCWGKPNKIAGE